LARFLIVSCLAETVGLAIRLMAEGHEVFYYVHSDVESDCGDGILQKVDDWRRYVEEADLVFFDDVRQKPKGDALYDSGAWYLELREKYPDKLIIGGHPNVARLENDRMFAYEVMQQVGIPTVPMHRFTSFEEAKKFVQENGGSWALKHNSQVSRDLAYVADEPEDMLAFLDWLDENWQELAPGATVDFVLQEAAKGIEFAVTCFFDGERFRDEACYLNQEIKRMLDLDKGPRTGQMGEIGRVIPQARLYRETLAKLAPLLQEWGYCGFIDLNCIVLDGDSFVPLEFTAGRPGYPTLYSWCELLDEPVGEWLLRMAQRDQASTRMSDKWVANVVLATGTFPREDERLNKLALVRGLEKTGLRHVWLSEMRYKDGKFYGAGNLGYLMVVTGRGDDIPEAVDKCYDLLEQIKVIPYPLYRQDTGLASSVQFEMLDALGWLG